MGKKAKAGKGHGKKGKGKDDPNTEHFSTGGLHHARGSAATTTSVAFVPGRGERPGPTFTAHYAGVAGQETSAFDTGPKSGKS